MTGPAAAVRPAMANVRDVGGLPTRDGQRVRRGVLYRSDAPFAGDRPPALEPWPPRLVIDLRSAEEAGIEAHPLAAAGASVLHAPLLAAANPLAMVAADEHDVSMVDGYPTLLGDGSVHARVATALADTEGPALIHCTAGKDRTGVVVAVLLSALGVGREDVIADYVASEAHLDEVARRVASRLDGADRARILRGMEQRHPHLMSAPPEAIGAVLDVLATWPGGAARWLVDHGVATATLTRLRERLLQT
jgi:protein-tyrosine phosphatase